MLEAQRVTTGMSLLLLVLWRRSRNGILGVACNVFASELWNVSLYSVVDDLTLSRSPSTVSACYFLVFWTKGLTYRVSM